MYTVKPDGSIECLTAKEAIDLQRLIQSTRIEPRPTSRGQPAKQPIDGDESAPEIAKQLEQYNGTEISSAQLMPIIGAKSSSGVGSRLYHLQNRIPLSEHVKLTKHRDKKGVVTWKVKLL
ncbi:MAG: hypothetical protein HY848_20600 [Betaproteobacteria bacterium]|nr:hypothetical protein [Betaproteobacteria bacterium]